MVWNFKLKINTFCSEAPQFVNYEYPRWEPYRPDTQAYYRIERDLRPETFYKQRAVDMWTRHLPALAGMTTPTNQPLTQDRQSETLYRTLAWAMVSVSIALLVVVVVLLFVLYNQKRSQSFKASTENQSRMSGSTLYWEEHCSSRKDLFYRGFIEKKSIWKGQYGNSTNRCQWWFFF